MVQLLPLCLLAAATLAAAEKPTVYLIRHGEKPADGNGLNAQGVERAQCLRSVFGKSSGYDIGHVMAQTPKSVQRIMWRKDGKRQRPLDTVKPLAGDLGLDVDTSCDRDDAKCVKKVVDKYDGKGNILICWEHDALKDIAEELGAKDVDDYPDESFDIIWTDPSPYDKITAKTSEKCPGLDK